MTPFLLSSGPPQLIPIATGLRPSSRRIISSDDSRSLKMACSGPLAVSVLMVRPVSVDSARLPCSTPAFPWRIL